jgi:hypothetical protein
MAKVIVERPRYGSRLRGRGKGYRKTLQRTARDELPKRERISAYHRGNSKALNEHLGPLRRYLFKQIGRPWDKVFAEICAHISRDSAVQDHVRDHVFDYVAVKVVEIDGVLHEASRWGRPFPLESYGRYPLLYVCPKTGLLKKTKKRTRQRGHQCSEPRPVIVPIDFEVAFIQHRGSWHRVRLASFPKMSWNDLKATPTTVADALRNVNVTRADTVGFYGRAVYATESRRASRDEIRRYCEPLKTPNLV